MACPNLISVFARQRIGSPSSAVLDEKFGSSKVQRKSVPAGNRISSAQATPLQARNTHAKNPQNRFRFIIQSPELDQSLVSRPEPCFRHDLAASAGLNAE